MTLLRQMRDRILGVWMGHATAYCTAATAVFGALILCHIPTAGQTKQPSKTGSEKSAVPGDPQTSNQSGYLGSEVCKTCHEDVYNNFGKTPHWKTTLDTRRGSAFQGCEACHGPGEAHVAGGGDKSKIFVFKGAPAKEVTARCLTCHQYGEEHNNFLRSAHSSNDVTCIDCHSPHHADFATLNWPILII